MLLLYKYYQKIHTWLHAFASCALLISRLFTELAGLEQSQKQHENQWETLVFSR